jgi:hypothetical protein
MSGLQFSKELDAVALNRIGNAVLGFDRSIKD